MKNNVTVDTDEHGFPVTDRYARLGAKNNEQGMFVRFEPGFGLNVHIGFRYRKDFPYYTNEIIEVEKLVMGINGWERLCELADEWRERENSFNRSRSSDRPSEPVN